MKFINNKTLKLEKELNELDKFVFDFINILENYTDYVIISGYVAILLGRSRSTEDVDIFIRESGKDKIFPLYEELKKKGYWCLNAEAPDEIFNYLNEGLAVRFALENQTIPNFEVKFAKKMLDKECFSDAITVITDLRKIRISSLERQVAFKRYFLKSDKDLEDANHIEKVFKDAIDVNRINEYKKLLENEMAKTRKR